MAQRVEAGGHKVPNNKIKERYTKSLLQVPSILEQCHRAYFFDNSHQKFTHFAEVTPDGYLDIDDNKFKKLNPEWFIEHVLKKWNIDKVRLASW